MALRPLAPGLGPWSAVPRPRGNLISHAALCISGRWKFLLSREDCGLGVGAGGGGDRTPRGLAWAWPSGAARARPGNGQAAAGAAGSGFGNEALSLQVVRVGGHGRGGSQTPFLAPRGHEPGRRRAAGPQGRGVAEGRGGNEKDRSEGGGLNTVWPG